MFSKALTVASVIISPSEGHLIGNFWNNLLHHHKAQPTNGGHREPANEGGHGTEHADGDPRCTIGLLNLCDGADWRAEGDHEVYSFDCSAVNPATTWDWKLVKKGSNQLAAKGRMTTHDDYYCAGVVEQDLIRNGVFTEVHYLPFGPHIYFPLANSKHSPAETLDLGKLI